MEKFIAGNVVVVRFPFSDLSNSKLRPALVLADWGGTDIILCQITSKNKNEPFTISLKNEDFIGGSLPQDSFIRVNKLFTAEKSIILRKAGVIGEPLMKEVESEIMNLLIDF
ncbi:type II toxin-antitoxin system PemK/MazF family toxin [uncultured Arcticibacterium sp.]|uniref:type II toxin-antitoxin system PemK/MazF family toxin n=1 Tax=uncultured Arcticibacterium sp. TaxID=2173042 RepID=UPI0030FB313D